MTMTIKQSELGKKSSYTGSYDPDLLFPISRQHKRDEIGIPNPPPFLGFDLWNHYEVSWLNEKGKPIVALAEIRYDCLSPNIIESKSMKLYFNSLNHTPFKDAATLQSILQQDLEKKVGAAVTVNLIPLPISQSNRMLASLPGMSLDSLDIDCDCYEVNPSLLTTEPHLVEETLHSNLLKSNCLVTTQPDWGSVLISYRGKKINHEGLLRYIVSFRNHLEFHEQCIERIFMDMLNRCQPTQLTVYGRYTRRGGLDINPYRSTEKQVPIENIRLCRQ